MLSSVCADKKKEMRKKIERMVVRKAMARNRSIMLISKDCRSVGVVRGIKFFSLVSRVMKRTVRKVGR